MKNISLICLSQNNFQECDGPYAWRKHVGTPGTSSPFNQKKVDTVSSYGRMVSSNVGDMTLYPHGPKLSACLSPDLLKRPALKKMFQDALLTGSIAFRLPTLHAVAGGVLRHCINVIDHLFERHYPMIYKIGFTHDCVWRWSNNIYGYNIAKEKWSDMVVLYISAEPYSTAMLEAALIEKYQ